MSKVNDFLTEAGVFFLATVDGDQPKARPLGAHLEMDGKHYYYGNLKALCDNWSKDKIGVSHAYLKNLNISDEKPFNNGRCIIRRGVIVTSSRIAGIDKNNSAMDSKSD